MERVVMRVTDISKDNQSIVVPNLHIGQLPKLMIIGFVASKEFHGVGGKNPFNFQNCNVSQISVEVDGQSFPTKPYAANFTTNSSLECYDGLLDALKQRNTTYGELPFDRDVYENGYTLFGFDLTPGATGRGPMTLVKQGNLSVSVTFRVGLPETMMMVCMMVYDSVLEINNLPQVLMDFKP